MRTWTLIMTCLCSGLLGCSKPVPQIAPSRPVSERCNIVWVSFDALQARHVSALGYARPTTPHLDAFARQSDLFERAYSVASWTVPSTMSWFTGVYPSEHRLVNKYAQYTPTQKTPANLKELAPHLTTLAEILRANGYATAGFTGNAGVNGRFGYDRGFDVYDHVEGQFGGFERSLPRALNWLRDRDSSKPFFLFLHGYDVHGQCAISGKPVYRFVDPKYDFKFTGTPIEQELLREEGLERGRVVIREQDVQFWRSLYDEKVQRADAKFAAFLDEYRSLGLLDRTLFVIASDHGTELHEHGRFDHGFSLYDEQLHVPILVRRPGQQSGRRIRDRVSSIDLLPTVLELAEVTIPESAQRQFRGQSLVPMLQGQRVSGDLFAETDYRAYTYQRAIISPDGWKLIRFLEQNRVELYDTDRDPGETVNLAEKEPQRAKELEAKLLDHFNRIGHDWRERRWEVGLNPVYPSQGKNPPKR